MRTHTLTLLLSRFLVWSVLCLPQSVCPTAKSTPFGGVCPSPRSRRRRSWWATCSSTTPPSMCPLSASGWLRRAATTPTWSQSFPEEQRGSGESAESSSGCTFVSWPPCIPLSSCGGKLDSEFSYREFSLEENRRTSPDWVDSVLPLSVGLKLLPQVSQQYPARVQSSLPHKGLRGRERVRDGHGAPRDHPQDEQLLRAGQETRGREGNHDVRREGGQGSILCSHLAHVGVGIRTSDVTFILLYPSAPLEAPRDSIDSIEVWKRRGHWDQRSWTIWRCEDSKLFVLSSVTLLWCFHRCRDWCNPQKLQISFLCKYA